MSNTVSALTPNCAKAITSSLYLPPNQEKGVTFSTPSIAAISASLAPGTGWAKPCELITISRLYSRSDEPAASNDERNDRRIIIRNRHIAVDPIVRSVRTGLRRALRRT